MRRLQWAIIAAGLIETAIGSRARAFERPRIDPAFTAATNLVVAWSFIACGIVAMSRVTDARFNFSCLASA